MTRRPKPTMHGRDHAADGPDPVPPSRHIIQDEGVALDDEPVINFTGAGVTAADNPGAGSTDVYIPGAAAASDYATASKGSQGLTAASLGLINWGTAHASGITGSGTDFTLSTSGVYVVHTAGMVVIEGPAAYPTGEVWVEVFVNGASLAAERRNNALFGVDIPSGNFWETPLAVLAELALAATDVVSISIFNGSPQTAYFTRWTVVIKRFS